jgi:BirA family biotin operon repressor/biotin-[acetyl-CoA-carboxylase] ligase
MRTALAGLRIGQYIEVHASVGSTMDALAALAEAGAAEGTVLLADEQRAGRGRHGRVWHTPPGVALALSVLFRPELPVERLPQIPMAVALAALDALEPRVPDPRDLALKWPNDLLVGEAKIAGLLSEVVWGKAKGGKGSEGAAMSQAAAKHGAAPAGTRPRLIVGLGLNVRQSSDALPEGATSVAALRQAAEQRQEEGLVSPNEASGDPLLDRTSLAIDLLHALDAHYAALNAGADLVPAWARRLATIGREVVAHPAASGSPGAAAIAGAPPVRGRAVGVAPSGALRIATDRGEVLVHAGDVTLQPPPARSS